MKSRAGDGEYLLSKGYRRPGLLWTADRRAAQRKQGLCSVLQRHAIHAVPQVDVPFRHRFRWGAAV